MSLSGTPTLNKVGESSTKLYGVPILESEQVNPALPDPETTVVRSNCRELTACRHLEHQGVWPYLAKVVRVEPQCHPDGQG